MITIIDYEMGNVGSMLNMLKRIGVAARISSKADDVRSSAKLILPGVGAFDTGMENLNNSGLREVIEEKVLAEKTPLLGVCIGMQLLTRGSEEGKLPGLGWIDAKTVRFHFESQNGLKIPHMGWNTVTPSDSAVLFRGFAEPPRCYFVHSYHVVCDDPADIGATVHHGYDITAAIQRGHILGAQFHPEKSHTYGMRLLKNFAAL